LGGTELTSSSCPPQVAGAKGEVALNIDNEGRLKSPFFQLSVRRIVNLYSEDLAILIEVIFSTVPFDVQLVLSNDGGASSGKPRASRAR